MPTAGTADRMAASAVVVGAEHRVSETFYDHHEAGWYLPSVKDSAQAAQVKQAVIEFTRSNFGRHIQQSALIALRFQHDGKQFSCKVGELLDFYGVHEKVWTIFKDPSRSLFLVVTQDRGGVRGGPVLVGEHDLL